MLSELTDTRKMTLTFPTCCPLWKRHLLLIVRLREWAIGSKSTKTKFRNQ